MNKALVLVDIQNDYFMRVQSRLDAPEKAAAQAKQALEYFRKNNWPVIFVQHISLKENAQSFAPGTPGAEIYEGVAPLPEEKIIIKHEPSSFYETELKDALYAKGVGHIVVCGMMSHMCIDTTVRAAKDLGFTVTLLEDACTTRNLLWHDTVIPATTVHQAFMASLDGTFATVKTTAEFIAES